MCSWYGSLSHCNKQWSRLLPPFSHLQRWAPFSLAWRQGELMALHSIIQSYKLQPWFNFLCCSECTNLVYYWECWVYYYCITHLCPCSSFTHLPGLPVQSGYSPWNLSLHSSNSHHQKPDNILFTSNRWCGPGSTVRCQICSLLAPFFSALAVLTWGHSSSKWERQWCREVEGPLSWGENN